MKGIGCLAFAAAFLVVTHGCADKVNVKGDKTASGLDAGGGQGVLPPGSTTAADASANRGGGGSAGGDGGSTGGVGNGVRSAGCGLPSAPTGDFHLTTNDGRGTSRDYEVIVPASYQATSPLPLTFVYHGAGASESAAKSFGLQNAPGAAAASIFVFPQGVNFMGYGVGWNDKCSGYDMPFFDNMVAYMTSHYCIDESMIFAAGFSWGGDHVTALSCCRGKRIRAIAAASCTDEFADKSNYKTYNDSPCPASGTTAVRFTYDPKGDAAYSAQTFATTSVLYASFNSCSSSTPTAMSVCALHQGCSRPYVECRYPGLGHSLPPSWAAETWAFFSSAP